MHYKGVNNMGYNKYTEYSAEQIVTQSYQDLSTLFLDMAKDEQTREKMERNII